MVSLVCIANDWARFRTLLSSSWAAWAASSACVTRCFHSCAVEISVEEGEGEVVVVVVVALVELLLCSW